MPFIMAFSLPIFTFLPMAIPTSSMRFSGSSSRYVRYLEKAYSSVEELANGFHPSLVNSFTLFLTSFFRALDCAPAVAAQPNNIAQVVGKMKGLMSSEASSTPEEEIDKFGAAYESGVNTKIAGLVKQHLVLVKENKDGSKEFNVYMSIDEAKAKKAREEAALAAKKQAALCVLSQQVEEFIGEPVEAEKSIWIYKGCSCGTVLRVQPFSVI